MTTTPEEIELGVQTIREVLKKDLRIPEYQRPYKWQAFHVRQLLDDLLQHFHEKKQYRLGTLVLHKDPTTESAPEDIVDGQQRLTTLYLLLKGLGQNDFPKPKLGEQKYSHSVSEINIYNNYCLIKQFIADQFKEDKETFAKYILDHCELVTIVLTDLDEAFQFFDSQNARGKSLAPYDLLKAYHLREMPKNISTDTVNHYVERWENAITESPNLDLIISQTLFRLRRWYRGLDGETFQGCDIDTFKGVSEQSHYPYLTAQQAAYALYPSVSGNQFIAGQRFTKSPFQISQTLFNGSYFFDYIEHYRSLYHTLFNQDSGWLKKIKIGEEDLLTFLRTDKYAHRTGDRYVRCLFDCAVMLYVDKFGEYKLEQAVHRCLRWSYSLRLNNKRVFWRTIENAACDRNELLQIIEFAERPQEILQFINCKIEGKANVSSKWENYFAIM